jgi:sirohydrochlorin cobaltochelatase
VAGGFIELSPPPLRDAVAGLVEAGHRNLTAVPLILLAAGHAKGDIPAALAREKERHPGLRTKYARPLGPHPVVLDLLRRRLSET